MLGVVRSGHPRYVCCALVKDQNIHLPGRFPLDFIDGKWYIYVALGVANEWRIRAFVLEASGANPLTSTWIEKGIIKTNW